MSNSVTVKVPARLHLGFLDLNGDAGRRFGSIGLPLHGPETSLTLSRAVATVVEGPESARAARHLKALCRHLGIKSQHRLILERAIPQHSGLGSGTQLALAVAAALRTLHRLPLDAAGDAMRLGRGARSGIGIACFADGGVIIDAGKSDEDIQPPVVARLGFPDEWRVILVLDARQSGTHGAAEVEAFRALPRFPATSSGEICRHVLMGLMPALVEHDVLAFGAAVTAIQNLVGTHFAPVQGGVFTSKRVQQTITCLAEAGAVGIGQSSWGPTGFAFAPSDAAARKMLRAGAATVGPGMEIHVVRGRNTGAEIIPTELDLVGS
jgi:beta-RFAP synthase